MFTGCQSPENPVNFAVNLGEMRNIDWMQFWHDYEPVIRIVIILVGAFLINKIVRYLVSSYFRRESPRINVDPTAYSFIKNAFTFIIVIIASISIIYSIPAFKQLAMTLFAGAGILAAVIGFASQTAFSNIINGVFIVIFKPFRIGDIIEIGTKSEYVGRVEDITLRHTVIKNFENKRVIVPNSVISTEIIVNRSIIDERVIRFLDINISYNSDLDKAIRIIQEECENHPLFVDPRTPEAVEAGEPKVEVRVMRLAEYAVQLRAYVCGQNSPDSFSLVTDLLKLIKARFDAEGIEIPLPYMNVILKNPPKP